MPSLYLSTAYFPPTHYFAKMLNAEQIFIEAHEHFVKQTYRSRCQIATANGALNLTVPVQKTSGQKKPIRDTRIDYSEDWQRQHWRTFVAAYKSSPFFEYYADDFLPFFEQKESFLFDLNLKITNCIVETLQITTPLLLTEAYNKHLSIEEDFRNTISPKQAIKTHKQDEATTYYQCFSDRNGFLPNLSILDLLFNEGNNARTLLKNL
ncbi:MAG: WbqC family protein [Phocaeicola sp.]